MLVCVSLYLCLLGAAESVVACVSAVGVVEEERKAGRLRAKFLSFRPFLACASGTDGQTRPDQTGSSPVVAVLRDVMGDF